MSETAHCLRREQLQQLIESELGASELAAAEEHLSACAACRAALDQAIADSDWWQLARSSLSSGESAALVDQDEDSAHSQLQSVLSLLGPTDDPTCLGRIANYEIVGILGRGGMGVVFKGFDAPLNRYVAIKMLLPHLAASGAARKRFAREAQAAAAVVDDYVMAIHTVAQWQGAPYLVMPYAPGVSLQKRLADEGPLQLREILRIGAQTAKGLAAAHQQGLVHRDIKPANILLPDGVERVSLTDFGLARAIDDVSVTRTGVLAGTPQYMSPEQARAQPVDFRSDLFSLGSVLYAMCTGRAPFRADTSYAVLRLITDEAPCPITDINADIPDWLCRLIQKLMAKQPEFRFASAQEVAELLEQCLAHVQHPAAVELPPALLPTPAVKSLTIRHAIVAVLSLAAVVLAGWAMLNVLPTTVSKSREPPHANSQRADDAAYFAKTRLEGTWRMTASVNPAGTVADEKHVRAVSYVIHDNVIEFHSASEPDSVPTSRFTLDMPKDASPGTPKPIEFIDYTTLDADGNVQRMRGLIESDSFTLKICWGPLQPAELAPALGFTYAELRRDPSELLEIRPVP